MPATLGIKTPRRPGRNHVEPRDSAVFDLVKGQTYSSSNSSSSFTFALDGLALRPPSEPVT
jgi:hypothetical protein